MAASDHLGAQFIDLYHRTSPEHAQAIVSSGRMHSPELNGDGQPAAFFSTHRTGQAEGYGDSTVHVRVPEHAASLEDEFPSGEQHYSVPVRAIRPQHIQGIV